MIVEIYAESSSSQNSKASRRAHEVWRDVYPSYNLKKRYEGKAFGRYYLKLILVKRA